MRSFVLGNGKSRLAINPKELVGYGKIYGCNALYREFEPDYLVAVDPKMIFEIEANGYQLTHSVWTNDNDRYKKFKGFNYFNPVLGWSSGPTALHLAAKHKPPTNEIYILGFDFTGINGLLNNVYADTQNYRQSQELATYHGNWEKQTEQVIIDNPHIKFYRVVEESFYDPNWNYFNFRHLSYENFRKIIETWSKTD